MSDTTKRGPGVPPRYDSKMERRVTLRIPESIAAACDAAAERSGLQFAEWARRALAAASVTEPRKSAPRAAPVDF